MLVVLDDLDPIDGIGGEVTTGLVVVRPQQILPLDVELIDGFTLVSNLSIRPDLYPRELRTAQGERGGARASDSPSGRG